jgi:hypothetical protein
MHVKPDRRNRFSFTTIVLSISLVVGFSPGTAQISDPTHIARPTPPTRDAHTAGYVAARELPDGTNPPANVDGNFVIGPTHNPAPEASARKDVPQGEVFEFTMDSAENRIYPGIAREPNTFGTADPTDPAKLVVTTSHPAPYVRKVAVYIPKQ